PQAPGAMTFPVTGPQMPAQDGDGAAHALYGTEQGLGGAHTARRPLRDYRDRGAWRAHAILQERPAERAGDLAFHRRLRGPRLPGLRGRADHLQPGARTRRLDRQLDAGP